MRKVLLALCGFISLFAQAQYKPMLKEGRSWQMSAHRLNLFKDEGDPKRHTIKPYMLFVGDKFEDDEGHTCYQIYCGDERSDVKPYSIAFVYEENGKLYEASDDCAMPPSPRLVIDFTPIKGGKYPYYTPDGSMEYRDVQKMDSVLVNGEPCMRIYLGETGYENEETYIVEGIGISNDHLLWYRTSQEAPSNGIIEWNTLEEVYDNGNCIFRASDFSQKAYEAADDTTDSGNDGTGIWEEDSEWDIYFEDDGAEDANSERMVKYRLQNADNGYMALEKTVYTYDGKVSKQLQGYLRNDHDTLIYARPVLEDGSIGEECLLYDFRTPFEYGSTIRYGVRNGEIQEEYIDWQEGSLEYYMLNGDTHLLPSWNGIVYRYGYLGGPMELLMMKSSSGKKQPKPTNVSHVIFSTKGGQKKLRMNAAMDEQEVVISYQEMLTEGTVWECLAVSTEKHGATGTYTIQVIGDTIVGNRLCKQIYSPEYDRRMTVFEEGCKMYVVNSEDTPDVLLDFGLQLHDIIGGLDCVVRVETQKNQGYPYKTITIDTAADCISYFAGDTEPWNYYLIEGIGANKDEYLRGHFLSEPQTFSYLLRCWKNGVLVYQAPGYEVNGIKEVNSTKVRPNDQLYDLQGRRLNVLPHKGIFISGNRKVVIR